MSKSIRLAALALGLGTLAVSAASFADESEHEGQLFSVPFFIENALATSPGALRADFTLKHPAVLETFSISCAGAPRGGILYTDGGPQGVNHTTGVGATSDVGLVVGLVPTLLIPYAIDFTVAADGLYFYGPTHIGVPVKSNYSFIIFPNAPNGVQCNANATFRRIE